MVRIIRAEGQATSIISQHGPRQKQPGCGINKQHMLWKALRKLSRSQQPTIFPKLVVFTNSSRQTLEIISSQTWQEIWEKFGHERVKTIMLSYFYQADADYGTRLAKAVNVPVSAVKIAVKEYRENR